MWKYLVFLNPVILVLCWCTAQVLITPAYNHFVQYADGPMSLPWITQQAVNLKYITIALPVIWGFVSFGIHTKHKQTNQSAQNRVILLFLMVTLCTGLVLIIFYLAAGIFPFLMINARIAAL